MHRGISRFPLTGSMNVAANTHILEMQPCGLGGRHLEAIVVGALIVPAYSCGYMNRPVCGVSQPDPDADTETVQIVDLIPNQI